MCYVLPQQPIYPRQRWDRTIAIEDPKISELATFACETVMHDQEQEKVFMERSLLYYGKNHLAGRTEELQQRVENLGMTVADDQHAQALNCFVKAMGLIKQGQGMLAGEEDET
jgi:hypothetical protein